MLSRQLVRLLRPNSNGFHPTIRVSSALAFVQRTYPNTTFVRYNSTLQPLSAPAENARLERSHTSVQMPETIVVSDLDMISDDASVVPERYFRDEPDVIVNQIDYLNEEIREVNAESSLLLRKTVRRVVSGIAVILSLAGVAFVVSIFQGSSKPSIPVIVLTLDEILKHDDITKSCKTYDLLFSRLAASPDRPLPPLISDARLAELLPDPRTRGSSPLNSLPFPLADAYAEAHAANAVDPAGSSVAAVSEAITIIDAYCDYLKRVTEAQVDARLLEHFSRAPDSPHAAGVQCLLDPAPDQQDAQPIFFTGVLSHLPPAAQRLLVAYAPALAQQGPQTLADVQGSRAQPSLPRAVNTPVQVVAAARQPFLFACTEAKEAGMTLAARLAALRQQCAGLRGDVAPAVVGKAELRLIITATYLAYVAAAKRALLAAATALLDQDRLSEHLNRPGDAPAPHPLSATWERDAIGGWGLALEDLDAADTRLSVAAPARGGEQ